MIPRFKPYLGKEEFIALFKAQTNVVARFEVEFAKIFEVNAAITFPYGRSGLWAFFKALNIKNAQIIMPAYTCVVVAHAIVLSGNYPRFVDIRLDDYNMDLEQVEMVINENTRAVIATHLFGYPLNIDKLNTIVSEAEQRYGHKIWIIQDCAHAFGAQWQGKSVHQARDLALFGLNISKLMTTIFGGLLTTNDLALAHQIRSWRDTHFKKPSLFKSLYRRLYLLAIYPAFNHQLYGLVYWLQEKTPFLNKLTKAYHLDDKIHFPPDHLEQMLDIEAQIGLLQLTKYQEIVQRRCEHAHYYHHHLKKHTDWVLPPLIEGATYSHYVIRVPDRMSVLKTLQQKGVQLGQLIEYSVSHLESYKQYTEKQNFPNSWLCSQQTINLPVYFSLSVHQREYIVVAINVT